MGRYFGREPRYSQEEAEAQAKAAIDAAVEQGRPPAEEWKALASRAGEIDRELATRPPVDILPQPPPRRAAAERRDAGGPGRPRVVSQILRPQPGPAPEPAEIRRPTRPAAAAPVAPLPAPPARAPRAPAAAPAKRATKASAPAAAPAKRSVRATDPSAPAAAKRPAGKKRPG